MSISKLSNSKRWDAQQVWELFPYFLQYESTNEIILKVMQWFKDNKMDFYWTGSCSLYEDDKDRLTTLHFRFLTEEDLMAFKLTWM